MRSIPQPAENTDQKEEIIELCESIIENQEGKAAEFAANLKSRLEAK